ncbi:inositol 2-dehydrogenase [Thermoanaerobacter uzonensis]|uniref:inositol 2-dehydrogenase n=1 Tax=Thermoanaerobacter uzonensis TaxID=447593 RepID=UPI003D7697EB
MKGKLRVGIIGAGRIGKMHAENIKRYFSSEVEIVSIADIFADKILDWANSIGINKVYKDHRAVLEDKEIDAVLICSSTDTHSQFIIEAAKEGKHIFCEKPIDFSVERIKEALYEVEKAGVKLQIGFQRRFDPHFRKMKEMIQEGRIGKLHIVKITSRDPEPPPIEYIKVSGGIFLDMTIHDFDMSRYLTASEVEEVFAVANVFIDPKISDVGDVDTAIVTLKFKNGILGIIDNSRKSVYGYDQRVEVFGSKGSVAVTNDLNSNVIYSGIEGIISDKPKYFFIERYKDAYIEEIKAFIDSIVNDKEVLVTGRDGLEPVLIGLAAKKSLEEKKTVLVER